MHHSAIQRRLAGFLDMRRRIEAGHSHFEVNHVDALRHQRQGLFVHAEALLRALHDPVCGPFHTRVPLPVSYRC